MFDGPNGTGNILATLALPLTPFNGAPDPTGTFSPLVAIGVSFPGTARSVDFGGAVNQIGFDDITIGSATPGTVAVPTLSEWAMIALAAVLALGAIRAFRTRTS
jgi:hypothetical protein